MWDVDIAVRVQIGTKILGKILVIAKVINV
jgi:hypothetical protein